MDERQTRLLRIAFVAGAITDGLAVIPMLSPSMAELLWGFTDPTGSYRFAMGYAATLMAGWTGLLIWAWRKPLERAFVAALTVGVIYGLVATEIVAVSSGAVAAWRVVPTFCLQALLLGLFATAYYYPQLRRYVSA